MDLTCNKNICCVCSNADHKNDIGCGNIFTLATKEQLISRLKSCDFKFSDIDSINSALKYYYEYDYQKEQTNDITDGAYIELFAVKNGVRYNYKTVSMKDMATILTNSLMDGVQELCGIKE